MAVHCIVTFGYFVELLFDARSEVVVQDVREVLGIRKSLTTIPVSVGIQF